MTGAGTRTTVEGADTLARTLQAAGRALEDMAPVAAGAVIESRSRAAAPYVSGALRSSIATATSAGRVTVGSDLEYAHVVHNGWAGHNIAANPFLMPVAEDSVSIWGPIYDAEAVRIIRTDVKGA